MRSNRNIKAFTLSEMIVVLILTSIVVGLAFSVLGLVQRHMYSIQQNYTMVMSVKTLETSLWLDFNKCQNITYDAVNEELKFLTPQDSVIYKFSEQYIIKVQDTFPILLGIKQLYFDGLEVNEGRVDAIRLETTEASQNQQLFIFKPNDATVFMN